MSSTFSLTKMMMYCQTWPQPVIRVKALAASGLTTIPKRFISQTPVAATFLHHRNASLAHDGLDIPVIDLAGDPEETVRRLGEACQEWGFIQVVNHSVRHDLMRITRASWRQFFNQTAELKEEFANPSATYEGYGSRLGVQKGAVLDWSDYFFLHFMPASLRNKARWPAAPPSLRFGRQYAAIQVFISILFTIVGALLSNSSLFEASSAIFNWDLTILPAVILITIHAFASFEIMPSFPLPSINAHLLRFIPQHEVFGDLIKELTSFVERLFPNSSPLEENSTRTWIFFASRSIYRCTGDVISGSLSCTALISFLISPHETPIYVFFIWAICVVSYLKSKLAAIPANDNDSTTDSGLTTT